MVGFTTQQEWYIRCIARGALGHAYLFFGDAHIGKSMFARSLASYLECGSFSITNEVFIDTEIFSPDEKGKIGIDAVHRIKKFLWHTPLRAPRRIVILEDAHTLTREAEAGMLKITEEPPPHGLLIFITHQNALLGAPLRSRLIKIYFPRCSRAQIISFLEESYALSRAHAEQIASRAFGSIGRACTHIARHKDTKNKEDILFSDEVTQHILALREKNLLQNVRKISLLLSRMNAFGEYNVNTRLQKAAIEFQLHTK